MGNNSAPFADGSGLGTWPLTGTGVLARWAHADVQLLDPILALPGHFPQHLQ